MLLDNKPHSRVVDALREVLAPGASASVLTNDLSVFAWNALSTALAELAAMRLLLAPATGDGSGHGPSLLGGAEERRFRNSLAGPRLARLMDAWLQRPDVEVRATTAEIMRIVFRDACFPDDVVKTNAVQILKRAGVADVKSL